MIRTQVLIAGCGPVGAVAAYKLAKAGIDVTVVEARPICDDDLRASTLHPPTLDMLEELGVLQTLIDQGLKAPIYQYRDRKAGDIFEFDLSELKNVSSNPYRLQCEQYKLTRLLSKLIGEHPHGTVRFLNRITSFEQDSHGVTAYVETPYAIETIKADYLIAADGGNSIIRKWLGIEFDGFTYPEKFLCLSTLWPLHERFNNLSYVNYIADPEEWVVMLKVPTVWRVLVPADNDSSDSMLLSDSNKDNVFNGLIGNDVTIETEHRTIYRVHQRVAKDYVKNRVILAGDAAHLVNPLGGLGMNSGIHDVWNLTDKLELIYKDKANPEKLLSLYTRQRKTTMDNFVQAQTIRNKKTMESKDPVVYKKYRDEMEDILSDSDKRWEYLLKQSLYTSLEEEKAIA